jgi:hypothetical protein
MTGIAAIDDDLPAFVTIDAEGAAPPAAGPADLKRGRSDGFHPRLVLERETQITHHASACANPRHLRQRPVTRFRVLADSAA